MNTTKKVKAYFEKCRKILPHDYGITEEETEEIAQSYLELQKELERKTKALEYIELDCQKAACPLGKRLYKFVREALSPDTNDH